MRALFSFVKQLTKEENRFVAWIAALAALGGFLFGFDTGVVGSAEPYFAPALHTGSFGESWVVGSLLLGAVCGAASAGYLADVISRKWTKMTGGIVFFIAAIGSAFPSDLQWLCVARFVIGLGVGASSFVAPMYISEQSPKGLRGGMTALNQVMITFGILVAYLSDYALSGIGKDNWRWMFGVEAVPGAALAVAMVFVPHTPRWLVEHDREEEAERVLGRTRHSDDIGEELNDIKDVSAAQRKTGVRQVLFSTRLRPFMIIGVVLAFLQQAVGINAILYFGAVDLKFMGLSTATAVYEAITLGIVNFVFAVVAVMILDWVGRKPLLVVGSAGMLLSLIGEGWFFSNATSYQHANAIYGLAFVLAFLAFFELSLGPVFWLMISELYPLRARAKAMAVATMVNWTFNFLVSYFYLTMTKDLGRDGTFWFFGFFALISVIFTAFKVPETKQRSLEQIEQEVRGDNQAIAWSRPGQSATA
ncbi:MAG TPA: sugar porter family MFS transporter [Acidimicrobiales bacterium]|nr:sugar porter family MFS transporter [Acidimicrobiales bacterium]